MSFPIASIRDDFANNVQDACWAESFTAGSATKAETSGQARLTLPSSTAGSHLAAYQTSARYDLTGDGFFWNIDTMVATGVAATAFMQLFIDSSNMVQWTQTSNTLKAQKIVAGVVTDLYSATWSASTYKYLRIRESGGNLLFDSSTNGISWTNRHTTSGLPIAVTALGVAFGASCGNVASPGSFRIEDVNLILPAPSATWRETTADWSITNRLRSITLSSDGGMQGVIVTADTMDETTRALGGTIHYFAGPLGSSSGGFLQLTEYASLALAEASAFPIPVDGRVDLPILVDARYCRLYHRSIDASAHLVYEYVPRRLVQADDIEAESIKAINISAGAITADKISVLQLSAISADVGTLTGGVIDGVTIYAGGAAHPVTLDASGIAITGSTTYLATRAYGFTDGTNRSGDLYAIEGASSHSVQIDAYQIASKDSTLTFTADAPTGKVSNINLNTRVNGVLGPQMQLQHGTTSIFLNNADVYVPNGNVNAGHGLNVGTATGAGTGQISTSGSAGIGAAVAGNVRLYAKGVDTGTNYAIVADDSAGTNLFRVRNDGAVLLSKSGGSIGFYGTTPGAKPTVTGSRATDAWRTSLMAALSGLGLLTDSSSA